MSILADVFMLLSCPECHGIQYLKLCAINEKRKVWQDNYLQLSCTVCCLYSITTQHTFFTTKQINLSKKNEEQQKLYYVNVRAIYRCRQARRN